MFAFGFMGLYQVLPIAFATFACSFSGASFLWGQFGVGFALALDWLRTVWGGRTQGVFRDGLEWFWAVLGFG